MNGAGRTGLLGRKLRLRPDSWGRLGEATAVVEGHRVFVFGAIPGEEVLAEVFRERRRYVAARVLEVLEPSPHRVDPPCPYFGPCTGCQWQHVDYDAQLLHKSDAVIDALRRIGGFSIPPVRPIVASPDRFGYRNHARFTIGEDGSLGFVNRETRQHVTVDECMLMDSERQRPPEANYRDTAPRPPSSPSVGASTPATTSSSPPSRRRTSP